MQENHLLAEAAEGKRMQGRGRAVPISHPVCPAKPSLGLCGSSSVSERA